MGTRRASIELARSDAGHVLARPEWRPPSYGHQVSMAVPIPNAVRRFVRQHVHELEQLEVLLLVHGVPAKFISVQEAARVLETEPELIASAFQHLAEHGLCIASSTEQTCFRYAPTRPELAACVDQIGEIYAGARIDVLVLMSSYAMERIRNASLRAFAYAFLFKQDNKK